MRGTKGKAKKYLEPKDCFLIFFFFNEILEVILEHTNEEIGLQSRN